MVELMVHASQLAIGGIAGYNAQAVDSFYSDAAVVFLMLYYIIQIGKELLSCLSLQGRVEGEQYEDKKIFDIEGASEDKFLMDLVNFNFNEYTNVAERIFKECLWKIAEQKLKKKQEELNDEYRKCEDLTRRAEIARQLGKTALQLKNKSLEEFNVRR